MTGSQLPSSLTDCDSNDSKAYEVIKQLSNQLARHLGNDEATTTCHTFQRLGVLLQRGNVALLSSRIPEYVIPEIDGEVDQPANLNIGYPNIQISTTCIEKP